MLLISSLKSIFFEVTSVQVLLTIQYTFLGYLQSMLPDSLTFPY